MLLEFWWHDANSMFLILQKKLRNFSKRQDQAKISFANFYVSCVFMCRCHEKTFYLLRTKSNSRFDYSYQWGDVYIGIHCKLILIKVNRKSCEYDILAVTVRMGFIQNDWFLSSKSIWCCDK